VSEIVYLATNDAMPGLVKIGRTSGDIAARISELSNTSVPLPFELFLAVVVPESVALERKLHQLFSENRVNQRREFFRVEPERVALAISIGGYPEASAVAPQVDADDEEALERSKERRPKIRLSALGINEGATLTFSRDESVTAVVVSNGKVMFQGQVMSLSPAAQKALQDRGNAAPSVSGAGYWMFEGELLDERRRRLEAATFEDVAGTDA
jgi:T5orf172 domain